MNATIKVFLIASLALGVLGAKLRVPPNKAFQCPTEDGFYPGDLLCTGDFYYCGRGSALPMQCPCSDPYRCTVFDPAQGACVDPKAASCSTEGIIFEPNSGGAPASGSVNVGTYSDTTSPPFNCSGDGFYPVPGTCSPNFYICAGSSVGSGVCPEGTLFDPVSYLCAPESETSCNVPFTCPESDGFFPYPGACSSIYYICISGRGFLQYCPENTFFDPLIEVCLAEPSCTPGEYSTTERTTTTQGPTTTTPFFCPADGNFPMSGECQKYYICAEGMAFVATCPGDLVFNPVTSKCDYAYNVPECYTTPNPTTKDPFYFECPTPNGKFPYEGNCTLYWICVDSVGTLTQCPKDTGFNPLTEKCELDFLVPNCNARGIFQVYEDTNKEFVCSKKNGDFPFHLHKCLSAYISCEMGMPFHRFCPDGEVFDPLKVKCVQNHISSCSVIKLE